MIIATFGEDISRFRDLSVIGGIVGGDWSLGGVLRPFVDFSVSRFSVSSVKLSFCFLLGKHMGRWKQGCWSYTLNCSPRWSPENVRCLCSRGFRWDEMDALEFWMHLRDQSFELRIISSTNIPPTGVSSIHRCYPLSAGCVITFASSAWLQIIVSNGSATQVWPSPMRWPRVNLGIQLDANNILHSWVSVWDCGFYTKNQLKNSSVPSFY